MGSRRRVWYKSCGQRATLIIRRLLCESCGRIHHELPNLLVPYKRFGAESMEGVFSEPAQPDVAADESTLYRWRNWFFAWVVYAAGCLQSIAICFNLPVEDSSISADSALQSLGRFVGTTTGWLSRAVRPIVNMNRWNTDPFCMSVRAPLR